MLCLAHFEPARAACGRTIGWSDDHYNWITRNKLRFGRCTSIDNVCAMATSASNSTDVLEISELRSSWDRCTDDEASDVGLTRKLNRSKMVSPRRDSSKGSLKRRNNASKLSSGARRRVKP